MTINAQTKIAVLLRHHPGALEAIVSISPKFSKLRNPVLRKVLAGRASIAMASKMGGCSVEDFFNKLKPLGFIVDNKATAPAGDEQKPVPEFFRNADKEKIIELDVRAIIESGKDPLNLILQNVRPMKSGDILKIINSFEPSPLMHLLGKQGFESFAEKISDDLVYTYFYKSTGKPSAAEDIQVSGSSDFDVILDRYKGKIESIDVRDLEMPLPMHAILEALDTLPTGKALFVYHKRIPVFLIPELEDRKFNYRIKEIRESEVHLLIYRD